MSVVVILVLAAGPLVAAEADAPDESVEPVPIAETAPVDQEAPTQDFHDKQARTQAYELGVMLIGGILIAGVGLIALVMIWGNRMRRIARQPLPAVAPRDELWFLKNKKRDAASASESSAADEAAE